MKTNSIQRGLLLIVTLAVTAPSALAQDDADPKSGDKILSAWVKDLKSPDLEVWLEAVERIADLRKKSLPAIDALVAALKVEDATVRALAGDAFKFLNADPKLSIPAIREAAKHKDSIGRKMALETLQFIDPEASDKDQP